MFSCRKISCKLMKLLQRQSPSSPLWRLPRVERGYDMTWVTILPPGWRLLPSPPAGPASASGTSSIFGLDTRPANIVMKTQPGFIWNKNANPILRKQTYPLICWRCLLTITNIRTKSIASMKAETGSKEVWNNNSKYFLVRQRKKESPIRQHWVEAYEKAWLEWLERGTDSRLQS